MSYKDITILANEGTDEGHEVTISFETVTDEVDRAIANASDEYSEHLGMTYMESVIQRYGRMFFMWFSFNTCAVRARRAFGDDEIAKRYAGFLASASLNAYEDALRSGKSGTEAFNAAEWEATNVSMAFDRHMLEDVRGMIEDLESM